MDRHRRERIVGRIRFTRIIHVQQPELYLFYRYPVARRREDWETGRTHVETRHEMRTYITASQTFGQNCDHFILIGDVTNLLRPTRSKEKDEDRGRTNDTAMHYYFSTQGTRRSGFGLFSFSIVASAVVAAAVVVG